VAWVAAIGPIDELAVFETAPNASFHLCGTAHRASRGPVRQRTDRLPGCVQSRSFKQLTRSDVHESDHFLSGVCPAFNAEQALTRDTVPVNVDAIIFWNVHDAEKAALAITNYREAIDRVAQTSLREMIGSSMLAALLSDRKEADEQLKVEIGQKTAPWGISVSSVEIRDVAIPEALQNAMSRQAQAEREKQARVILGSAEAAIAGKFVEAAAVYAGHPWALQLRAMNIIYETTKERGATILMPSSMVDSLNPTAATLAFALAGNEPLAGNRAALNVEALVTKGVPAATGNGAAEPGTAKTA
jgi:SPFH domain / Band 7 family